MKVKVVITSYYKISEEVGWGIPRYAYQLVKNLKKIPSVDVTAISENTFPKNILEGFLKKTHYTMLVARVRGDVYHAITPTSAIPLILLGKRPNVATLHDLLNLFYKRDPNSLGARVDYKLHEFALTNVDAIISIAEYWRNMAQQLFSIPSKKIYVVYQGVDTEKYRPLNISRIESPKRILFVGTPSKPSGMSILLKAYSIVERVLKDVELLLGGKHNYVELLKLCKKYGVQNVKFLGFVPERELPYLYNSVHVFVEPPTDEFSLMLLEAMACGTPVIARDIFEMREYLGDAALLVKSEDPSELAEAIMKLLSDEKLWFRLSRKGLERARRFTWRRTAEETYRVYMRLLE